MHCENISQGFPTSVAISKENFDDINKHNYKNSPMNYEIGHKNKINTPELYGKSFEDVKCI